MRMDWFVRKKRLTKITKNKPRFLSSGISSNILRYALYKKLSVSYTYKQPLA